MVDPLSDDAKVMLALIRKYPGIKHHQVIWELHLDVDRFQKAIFELQQKNLVEVKWDSQDDKFSETDKVDFLRFFPFFP